MFELRGDLLAVMRFQDLGVGDVPFGVDLDR